MKCASSLRIGLMFSILFGLIHLVWATLIATQMAKPMMDWILALHFLQIPYTVLPFNYMTAGTLLGFTMIVGFVFGTIFGWLWNMGCEK